MKNFKKEILKLAEEKGELPVFDGVINSYQYSAAPVKILWILKDLPSLDKKQSFDLKAKIATISTNLDICQDFKNTFGKIAEASATILNRKDRSEENHDSSTDNIKNLEDIALISIKKFSDGKKASHKELLEYYQESKKLLHKQIEILNPDVILFVDSYSYFQNDLNLNQFNSFGSCMATAKGGKIYMNVKKPGMHMDGSTCLSDCLQAYQVFQKQINRLKKFTYPNEAYQNDLEELKHLLEQALTKTNQIERRLLNNQKYEQVAKMRDVKKVLIGLADEYRT